jgi:hypothetical protein
VLGSSPVDFRENAATNFKFSKLPSITLPSSGRYLVRGGGFPSTSLFPAPLRQTNLVLTTSGRGDDL